MGFTPYGTNGYWIFTEAGWTWVSNYSWGWAPFHYGRWYTDATYGFVWVPGNEWGPGWVTWRRSSGYYGWAPIGPGISINVAYGNAYHVPHNQWIFVQGRNFGKNNISNYYVNSSNNTTIINKTKVINSHRTDKTSQVTYNTGPDRDEVEKHIGKTIDPLPIKESSAPSQNLSKDHLQVYRPQMQKNSTTGRQPVPVKVSELKDVRTLTQRSTETINSSTEQKINPHGNKIEEKQPKRPDQPTRQYQSLPKNMEEQKQSEPLNPHGNKIEEKQPKRPDQPTRQYQSLPKNMEERKQSEPLNPHGNKIEEKQPKRPDQPARQYQSFPKNMEEQKQPQHTSPTRK